MLSILKILGISLLITFILIGVGIFLISKYARSLEEKTGLSTANSEQQVREALLNAPSDRALESELEIYTPLNLHVYKTQKLPLQGKVQTKNALLILNGESQVLKTDNEGKFNTNLDLKEGANQVALLARDSEGQELLKELIVGYLPGKKDQHEYKAFIGQVMAIDQAASTINLSVGTELFKIKTSPNNLSGLDITEQVGVVALKSGQELHAQTFTPGFYPFIFYGNVLGVQGKQLTVERKKAGGYKATVNLETKTITQKWDINGNSLDNYDSINSKDRVLIVGNVKPKEDRTNYFAERVILLKH